MRNTKSLFGLLKMRFRSWVPALSLIGIASFLSIQDAAAVPSGYLKYTVPLGASPAGLAFDSSGILYALEAAPFLSNTTQIRVIQPGNTLGTDILVTGNDPDNFFAGGMTYDPISDGLLITDNTADGRLYLVSKTGVQQTLTTGIPAIADVAVRSTGEIFVSAALGDNVGEVLQVDRVTGNTTPVVTGLDFGAGLAFEASGDLLVLESDATNFTGRLHRLPITEDVAGLQFGSLSLLLAGMQSSFGLAMDSEEDIFATGSGGLFSVDGSPLSEASFDDNGQPFPFATALAFDSGPLPFEPFSDADAGRLAYSSSFSDSFVTLIRPTPPVDANFNDDANVGQADLQIWQQNFGAAITATNALGDADGDFDVDGSDFLNWQRQFDAGSLATQVLSVPEPATCILLLTGWSIFPRRQQTRKKSTAQIRKMH